MHTSRFLRRSAVAVALLGAFAGSAFAQSSDQPVTRAQVRADLVKLENAGYNPGVNDPNYPQNLQAAERQVYLQDQHPDVGVAAARN